MSKTTPDFFNQKMASDYDERNSKLSQISDCFQFLYSLILQKLPAKAHILCVGAGTGAEILTLSKIYPEWTFVALDPSGPMLDICRERTRNAGIADRCKYVQGYIHDLPLVEEFDAVLSVLVGHFVPLDERASFYLNMSQRLKAGGILINLEISFDLESKEFPSMLENWKAIQSLMGATPESLSKMKDQLKEMLTILPPQKIGELIQQSGIKIPVSFFQAFLIVGHYGVKES